MSVFPVKKTDLKILVKKFDIKEGFLNISVPYPENYPMTKFRSINYREEIAYLKIDFNDVKSGNYILLDLFFVYSSKFSIMSKYLVKEEIELSKGIGKKMLCYAINLLINNKIIDKMTTIIKLYACGGFCPYDKEVDEILSILSLEDIDNWLFENIKTSDINVILKLSVEEKAKNLCEILNNLKLLKYYEEYGLKQDVVEPEDLDLRCIPMSGYIYDVLKKCENITDKEIANVLLGIKRKRGENYDGGKKKQRSKSKLKNKRSKRKTKK